MYGPLPFPARKRTRLNNYDYSQSGHYFITICTNKREDLFWDDKNQINDAGNMAYKWLFELENKFGLYIDCWTIMPNHVHAVIVIENKEPPAGGHIGPPLRETVLKQDIPVGADLRAMNRDGSWRVGPNAENQAMGGHIGPPLQETSKSLSTIVQWFKTMTTNAYIRSVKENNWKRFNGQLWQRSFYDHIIRTDRTLDNIREYISTNPAKWELDVENRKNNIDKDKYYNKMFDK
jgi:putative transposase